MTQQTSFSTNPALKSALERAEALLKALDQCERTEQAKLLKDVIDSARQMKFAIGVVGQLKRGKSTLINGLLGRSDDTFAPVDRFPATNVVSCFADGIKEEVTVLFAPDEQVTRIIPASEIKHYACEDFNPGNQKGVKGIDVVAPFPRLGKNVVLVDTPGADNALSHLHDIVLLECLPRLDAVIFLVTADEPLTASELELLKQVKQNDVKKVLFAINKADKCEPEEIAQGLEHNRRVLTDAGYGAAPIFVMSARNYQKTGADDGTERLLFAVGEMIGEGRAKAITERLADIVDRQTAEAREALAFELQLCEMTTEQARTAKADLLQLRKRLAEARPRLERIFRSSWTRAFSDFEDELPAIEKRMISEYGDLIERTWMLKVQPLGQTIHTDILKRLDELLETPSSKLLAELDQAGKMLEVEYRNIPGLVPRQIDAIRTNKDMVKAAVDVAVAGVPAGVVAFVCASVPGLVATTIAATAPAVVTATLTSPSTWLPALGTALGSGATGLASGAAATILSPLAAIGAPIAIVYAGYRVFSAWKGKLAQTKNELSLAAKDLIIGAIAEVRKNFKLLKKTDEAVLTQFHNAVDAKLDESETRLNEIVKKRPAPERIANLRSALQLIDRVEPDKTLPSTDSPPAAPQRLFPT